MLSNNVVYQGKVLHAARELSRMSPLGCPPRRLSGYRVTKLGSYKVVRAVRNGLSGLGAPEQVAMIPVSDPSAVANAIKLFQRAQGNLNGFHGLSSTSQATGAASMAATGAKVGSIVPGIGTVIGAVVGAVAGWIMGKSKPVRASGAEIAQCKSLMNEYMGFAAQSPNKPLPLEFNQLLDMNWCVYALYGSDIGLRDPRWFNNGFQDALRPIALEIVKKIYETPVGAQVNLQQFTFKDPKGRTLSFKGFSFTNPVFTDLKTFTDQFWLRVGISFCENTAGKGAGGCGKLYAHEEFKRLMYDLLAWAARTTLPNISENDLRAASQVASQVGGSAKDVVSAVESIIKRNVVKEETAALLAPTPTQPTPVIPVAAIAPYIPPPTVPITPVTPVAVTPVVPEVPPPMIPPIPPSVIPELPPPTNVIPFPGVNQPGGARPPVTRPPTTPIPVTVGVSGVPTWAWIVGALFASAVLLPKKRSRK